MASKASEKEQQQQPPSHCPDQQQQQKQPSSHSPDQQQQHKQPSSHCPDQQQQQKQPSSHSPDQQQQQQQQQQDRLGQVPELNSCSDHDRSEGVRKNLKPRPRGRMKQHRHNLNKRVTTARSFSKGKTGGSHPADGETTLIESIDNMSTGSSTAFPPTTASSRRSSDRDSETEFETSRGGNGMMAANALPNHELPAGMEVVEEEVEVRDREHEPLLGDVKCTCNFKVLCCSLLVLLVVAALLLAGFVTGLALMHTNEGWTTVPVFISSNASYKVYSGAQTVLMTMVCIKTNTTNNLDWILYTASCSADVIKERRYTILSFDSTATTEGYYFYLVDGSVIESHPKGIAKYCGTRSAEQASKLQQVCDAERKCEGEKLKDVIGEDPFEDAKAYFYYVCVTGIDELPNFQLDVTEVYYHIPDHERNKCKNEVYENEEILKCCRIPQQSAYTPGQNCVYIGNNNNPSANPITAPFKIELRITYDSVMKAVLGGLAILTMFVPSCMAVVVLLLLCFVRGKRKRRQNR